VTVFAVVLKDKVVLNKITELNIPASNLINLNPEETYAEKDF